MTLRRFVVVICVLGIAGCTLTRPLPEDLPEQVEAWVANEEYGRALSMLDKVRSRHPRYIELIRMKPDIQAEAQAFARGLSREARQAWHADDWSRAYQRLEYGLDRYPQSEELQQTRQRFESARQSYLNELQRQLDLNTAPYAAGNIEIHRSMARAAPDRDDIVQRTRRKEKQLDALYARLVNCGMQAEDREQWQLARRCLSLADELKPGITLRDTLEDLDKRLVQQAERKANQLRSQSRRALEEARAELDKDNVKQALQAYKRIERRDRDHREVRTFKQKLDARIDQSIKEGIEVGRKFYTQGKIERALAIWHALKAMDAHHEELNAHIARAEKVLSKIKSLREDESVLPPQRGDNDN